MRKGGRESPLTHYHCPQEKRRRRRKLAVTRHKECDYILSAPASCPPTTLIRSLVDESPAISPCDIFVISCRDFNYLIRNSKNNSFADFLPLLFLFIILTIIKRQLLRCTCPWVFLYSQELDQLATELIKIVPKRAEVAVAFAKIISSRVGLLSLQTHQGVLSFGPDLNRKCTRNETEDIIITISIIKQQIMT